MPDDTWAPLLIVVGRSSDFGTYQNFTAAVERDATIKVTPDRGEVSLHWNSHTVTFFPTPPGTESCKPPHCPGIRMPVVDGVEVDTLTLNPNPKP